jgi:hypothetical protein
MLSGNGFQHPLLWVVRRGGYPTFELSQHLTCACLSLLLLS